MYWRLIIFFWGWVGCGISIFFTDCSILSLVSNWLIIWSVLYYRRDPLLRDDSQEDQPAGQGGPAGELIRPLRPPGPFQHLPGKFGIPLSTPLSLLGKGVLLENYPDPSALLAPSNISQVSLERPHSTPLSLLGKGVLLENYPDPSAILAPSIYPR